MRHQLILIRALALVITIGSILFLLACQSKPNTTNGDPNNLAGKISLSGAFALYPMAVKWGEEFTKIHPNV